jgi:hypothetical protein
VSKIIQQIEEIKRRRALGPSSYFDSGFYEVRQQLDRLVDSMESTNEEPSEIWKLYPIGICTCLENAVRTSVKALLDSGEPFASNARNIKTQAFKLEDIMEMIGKKVTGGELVAHLIPVSKLSDIDSNLSSILGETSDGKPRRFLKELEKAKSYDAKFYGDKDTPEDSFALLTDPQAVYEAVERVFALRHITVHEIYNVTDATVQEIKLVVPMARDFIEALLNYVSEAIDSGRTAGTQFAMTAASTEAYMSALERQNSASSELQRFLDKKKLKALSKSSKIWESYLSAEMALFFNTCQGGTAEQMCYNRFATKLIESRTEHLQAHIEVYKQHPDYQSAEE